MAAPQYFTSPRIVPGERYSHNFPDPFILRVGATYYAYATSTGGKNLPVLASTDLFNWFPAGTGEAMPTAPSWAVADPIRGQQWAPAVIALGGRYVAYSSWEISPGRRCIAVATGPTPAGPFTDQGSPLQCDWDPAGSIDPEPFVAPNGIPYLLWKSEGERNKTPTRLWSRQLAADGRSFAPGAWPSVLLTTALAWEQPIIENPSMVLWRGGFHLAYSAGDWESSGYATGIARCAGPSGPCTRSRTTPLLPNDQNQLGPAGGAFLVDALGQLRFVYHAWNPPFTSYPRNPSCDAFLLCASQGYRGMRVAHLAEQGGTLTVASSDPVGSLNVVYNDAPGSVTVWGWAIDPDTAGQLTVQLLVDGQPIRSVRADRIREDLVRLYPAYGTRHGFSETLVPIAAGRREVCAVAQNVAWGNSNSRLGCTTLTVSDTSSAPGWPPALVADVRRPSWYATPVDWAYQAGVTQGVGPWTFGPSNTVTRAQAFTMLWRDAGEPAPTIANPFSDVPPTAYYATAATWAYEEGITVGVGGSDRFEGGSPLSRAQAVTILWRYDGSSAPTIPNPFLDVPPTAYYATAATWAYEQGITIGVGGSAYFEGVRPVTRAENITFLWRFAGEPPGP